MSATKVGRCVCSSCTIRSTFEGSYRPDPLGRLFGNKTDAFSWGALMGGLVVIVAALVGIGLRAFA